MEDTSMGVEKVLKNKNVCSEDRRHLLTMLDMTVNQLYELAYLSGYEDATKKAASAVNKILNPGSETQSQE